MMRRKPNAAQRRRDLCDAAIELLAEDGARGLTHLRVDDRAGVADGTTSFYFQTRSALVRGATDRVVQLDVADFTAAMDAISIIVWLPSTATTEPPGATSFASDAASSPSPQPTSKFGAREQC